MINSEAAKKSNINSGLTHPTNKKSNKSFVDNWPKWCAVVDENNVSSTSNHKPEKMSSCIKVEKISSTKPQIEKKENNSKSAKESTNLIFAMKKEISNCEKTSNQKKTGKPKKNEKTSQPKISLNSETSTKSNKPEKDETIPKKRCPNWPACKKNKCKFVHPTMDCWKFSKCKKGRDCTYLHPWCKKKNCEDEKCVYFHTNDFADTTNEIHKKPQGSVKLKMKYNQNNMNENQKPSNSKSNNIFHEILSGKSKVDQPISKLRENNQISEPSSSSKSSTHENNKNTKNKVVNDNKNCHSSKSANTLQAQHQPSTSKPAVINKSMGHKENIGNAQNQYHKKIVQEKPV